MEEQVVAALEQLRGTPGVIGAWLAQASGGLVRNGMPPAYKPAALSTVAAAVHRLLSSGGAWGALELAFEAGRLRAELVEGWVLLVLTTPGADPAWVRLSCEVARARLREGDRAGPARG